MAITLLYFIYAIFIHRNIPQVIYIVLWANNAIPTIDHVLVHLFNAGKIAQFRAILPGELKYVGVAKMRVRNDENVGHKSLFVLKQV